MQILSGKIASKDMKEALKNKIFNDTKTYHRAPCLAVIMVGNNEASLSYIKGKEKACKLVGIDYKLFHLSENTTQKEVEDIIIKLNNDDLVDGMILQLPVPKQLDDSALIDLISKEKDSDGFHVINQGYLYQKRKTTYPATPKGIIELLEYYGVKFEGLNATVIGRSNIVGFPVARMLMDRGATITVCHSKTRNLSEHTLNADLIVVATGKPNLLTKEMVKPGVIVVDVGTNRVDGRLLGDVDFAGVSEVASMISPVPGGVGPMTIYGLLENTYELYLKHVKS